MHADVVVGVSSELEVNEQQTPSTHLAYSVGMRLPLTLGVLLRLIAVLRPPRAATLLLADSTHSTLECNTLPWLADATYTTPAYSQKHYASCTTLRNPLPSSASPTFLATLELAAMSICCNVYVHPPALVGTQKPALHLPRGDPVAAITCQAVVT